MEFHLVVIFAEKGVKRHFTLLKEVDSNNI